MTQREKLYAKRDAMALDEAGNYYIKHVMAMTSEQLHSKSAIAGELAHRDMLIDKLTKELQAAKAQDVPEGWKLVPVDPNHSMRRAMIQSINTSIPVMEMVGRIYNAGIAAAPSKEQP